MASNTSQTVAVTETESAATVAIREKLESRLAEMVAVAPVDSGEDGLRRLLLRLANAETIEDAAAIFEKMDNSITVTGIPLMINGFVLRESTIEPVEGDESGVRLPFYATVFATRRDNGAEINFNVGAASIVMTLLNAAWNESRNPDSPWFPFTAHVEGKTIAKTGRTVRNLIFDK